MTEDHPTHEEFRAVGMTGDAALYPMTEVQVRFFAAYKGVTVEQLPKTFMYYPNESSKRSWERLIDAVCEEYGVR